MNKLSKEGILLLIEKICNGRYKTQKQLSNDIYLLESNTLDPQICDYIFHYKPELTPEEIYEKTMAYKPIITPPPPNWN